jgi:serine/threonine-protein kinase
MAELVGETQQCSRCGYAAAVAVAVADEAPGPDPIDAAARRELTKLFAVERLHRRGPASIVYFARDLESDRPVALKVMPRSPQADGAAQESFHRSVAAAAALDHRHVVPIYGAGTSESLFWYSTTYVDGPSLAELLSAGGPMDLPACVRLVAQVASALEYGHRQGVVHADLKPTNVLIDAAGLARVTDFHVPRVLEQLAAPGRGPGSAGSARRVEYIAPEEFTGQEPGPPADQYALALLFYECLTGNVPFYGETARASGEWLWTEPPPLADLRPDVDGRVSLAVERALSRAPERRFSSIPDFVAGLGAPAPIRSVLPARPAAPQASPVREASPVPAARPPLTILGLETLAAAPDVPVFRTPRWIALGALALAVLGAVGAVVVLGSGRRSPQLPAPSPAPVAPIPAPATATPAPVSPSQVAVMLGPPESAAVRPESTVDLPRPAVAPSAPRAKARVPGVRPRRQASAQQPGRLFINATPWGQVYLDGTLIGNTPQAALPVVPGSHRVRVVRAGFRSFETTFRIAPGQELRLTDIVLGELKQ